MPSDSVLQLFIIICGIIASIYLILKYKQVWKKPEECSNCKKDQSYHMFYISGFFVLIIILFFTYNIVNEDSGHQIYEYFSFASVIVSIILAVLTIIYSYFINSDSKAQVEKLNKSSSEISTASKSIVASSESLANNLAGIISKLDHVQSTVEKTNDIIGKQPQTTESADTLESPKTADEIMQALVQRCSPYGGITMLICLYSYTSGKAFKLKDIIPPDSINEYLLGYLIALSSIRAVDFKLIDQEYHILSINSNIQNTIRARINAIISGDNTKLLELIIKNVEHYFNISGPDSIFSI